MAKRRNTLRTSRIFSSKAMARILPFPLAGRAGMPLLLVILSCAMLLVSSLRPQVVEGFRAGVVDMVAPVLEVVTMPLQTAALFIRDISGLAVMQAENARLKEENTRLREWHQTALLLEAENKSLRELMNVKIDPPNKFISARILSDAGGNFARSLLVSAGLKDGVKKGQAVMASDGLIGRIIEVGDSTARVLLITDINSRVPVLVENSRLHAIFTGTNGDEGRLMHLSQDSHVTDGAHIVTSGYGEMFPYGLPIGIAKADGQGQIKVQPFVDFKRMVHVRIIDRPVDPHLREGILK